MIFCNEFCLVFVAANIRVYFQYLFVQFLCANIFGAIVLKPRFKIDVVIMLIYSIVEDSKTSEVCVRIY